MAKDTSGNCVLIVFSNGSAHLTVLSRWFVWRFAFVSYFSLFPFNSPPFFSSQARVETTPLPNCRCSSRVLRGAARVRVKVWLTFPPALKGCAFVQEVPRCHAGWAGWQATADKEASSARAATLESLESGISLG